MERVEALEMVNAERNLPRVMAPPEAIASVGATRQDRRRINAIADLASYKAQAQAQCDPGWGQQ